MSGFIIVSLNIETSDRNIIPIGTRYEEYRASLSLSSTLYAFISITIGFRTNVYKYFFYFF